MCEDEFQRQGFHDPCDEGYFSYVDEWYAVVFTFYCSPVIESSSFKCFLL